MVFTQKLVPCIFNSTWSKLKRGAFFKTSSFSYMKGKKEKVGGRGIFQRKEEEDETLMGLFGLEMFKEELQDSIKCFVFFYAK